MPLRWHYIILCSCVFVIGLMFLETYLLPRGRRREVVTDERTYSQYKRSGGRYTQPTITTNAHTYDVDPVLYSDAGTGDTLSIRYGLITHSPQEFILDKPDVHAMYKEGFLYYGMGTFYTIVTLAGILTLLAMVARMSGEQGKRNLTVFLLVSTLLLFFFYVNPL